MIDTAVLVGVAIALVFVFSLVAILVTQINNLISNVLNLRSRQLKEGLEYLVSDPEIQKKLLSHPIINILPDTTGLTEEQAKKAMLYAKNAVNYIPSSTFVEALVSILVEDLDRNVFSRLELAINDLPAELISVRAQLLDLIRQLREQISDETVGKLYQTVYAIGDDYAVYRDKLLNGLKSIEEALRNLEYRTFQRGDLVPILNGVKRVENEAFRNALQSVLTTARSLDEGRERLALWFDDNMNRASELFQKRLQVISFIVAFIITILFNIDAIYITRVLLTDTELRDDVVRAARSYERQAEAQGFLEQPEVEAQDVGGQDVDAITTSVDEIRETAQGILSLQLPIGWQFTPVNQAAQEISDSAALLDLTSNPRNLWNFSPANNPSQWVELVILKILGIIITTIAAAQGAPFWFDLLRKISGRD
ncbi:MAG: hypothetical protein OHK0046_49960 [Anaerolineae bacterium]